MCWKHEWAMAINNLQHAIDHIEKARSSLEKRLERNKKSLEKHQRSKKWNYPKLLNPIKARIEKNRQGIKDCGTIIIILRTSQDMLYYLIKNYGISRKASSERLKQLMGKYQPPDLRGEGYGHIRKAVQA